MLVPLLVTINHNYGITLFFLSITFLLAFYRSITTIIISRRYEHKYSPKDYHETDAYLYRIEIFTYRLLGLVFVTVGTILYIKNKEGWNAVKRSGVNNQSYGDGIAVHKEETRLKWEDILKNTLFNVTFTAIFLGMFSLILYTFSDILARCL